MPFTKVGTKFLNLLIFVSEESLDVLCYVSTCFCTLYMSLYNKCSDKLMSVQTHKDLKALNWTMCYEL